MRRQRWMTLEARQGVAVLSRRRFFGRKIFWQKACQQAGWFVAGPSFLLPSIFLPALCGARGMVWGRSFASSFFWQEDFLVESLPAGRLVRGWSIFSSAQHFFASTDPGQALQAPS